VVTAAGERYAYADLLRAAGGIADGLAGGSGGDLDEARVAFMCPPGPAYVACQWGIWAAGGVAVPLHPGHPTAELEYVLQNSQPTAVLCHTAHHGRLEPLVKSVGMKCVEVSDADVDGRTEEPSPLLHSRFDDDAVAQAEEARRSGAWDMPGGGGARRALMIYTSGTTGRPKGAVHTHGGLTAQMESLTRAWE
jgi:malonyl-CoA/methylmalonyl-CoA synthetase